MAAMVLRALRHWDESLSLEKTDPRLHRRKTGPHSAQNLTGMEHLRTEE